ncbi:MULTISPECIES: SCP2 sterol-binding domain-containing protein [Mameliella]|jgi:putative sterol carrier protein|uniref:SCP-2 sterol transfer family protein n=1 Tax=Mameliella alba TaxID=561184 RepID=A0A0B3SUW5_9RHOB|nr:MULTISPECIES: SCP2 sterol-binding domain-containing protein [Mameliella]MCR9273534.1 SCP2 sterol-binding domain-containing protein [Paracoccaceae bacterium]ODM47058.1 sterol carrier family protein [Ruegeria sp. PBVC088]KHQ54244.1 SCP-2 sterol transfer family protein [Mameliella alba]MBY6118639.1 SCP2 sterol-binding domain-containing protein [Mameliella alba]MDD9733076.1 SCP2 sterol-binding domain-containing protein [Mameliella sp. AT18]
MSDTVNAAVKALNEKMGGNGFDGTAKMTIEDEGSLIIDENGAHAGDESADVTMTASADTFLAIVEGDLDPTSAFMSGKLAIEGDMSAAMRLAQVLA